MAGRQQTESQKVIAPRKSRSAGKKRAQESEDRCEAVSSEDTMDASRETDGGPAVNDSRFASENSSSTLSDDEPGCGMTDSEIVEGVETAIESEDIHFLSKIGFYIKPSLLRRISGIEKLAHLLSKNLGTRHKLKIVRLIKHLLYTGDVRDPGPIASNIKNALVDYTKLLYLKGKIAFMRHRMQSREMHPENVVEEKGPEPASGACSRT